MSCRANNNARRGFTLIEVMTATMIVALLTFSLYRFLTAQLRAIRLSQDAIEERDSMNAVAHFLQAQLAEMPAGRENQLLGQPNQFHGEPSDELTWLCRAGQGTLTSAAQGEYRVTLAVQPTSESSSTLELGLRRERVDADSERDVDFYSRGGSGHPYNWLPLIQPMAAMEIRYFDRRLNVWVERWNDPRSLPPLVKVRLWKHAGDPPMEAVLTVPAGNLQR